jgi:periplasmic copper chaperone A
MKTKLIIFSIILLALAACTPGVSTPASTSGILVDQAVVRLPGGSMPEMNADGSLAGYLRIKNSSASDDSLVGVQTNFAGMSMLHKSSVDSNSVATMEMVMAIKVPAGQTVELKPGDLHIMFTDLKQDLKAGDMVTLVLQFEKAGSVSVQAQVTNK